MKQAKTTDRAEVQTLVGGFCRFTAVQ